MKDSGWFSVTSKPSLIDARILRKVTRGLLHSVWQSIEYPVEDDLPLWEVKLEIKDDLDTNAWDGS